MNQTTIDALKAALVKRGPNKGSLLASAPRSDTLAYAAWQGAMLAVNPFKVSIGGLMFMTDEQRLVKNEVCDFFDANPHLRFADRDRATLEKLGVW